MKVSTKNGYAKLANGLTVALATAKLSGRELSVVLFIIRATYGWGRKWTKKVTALELVEGKMSKSSVCLALSVLLERGIVKRDEEGRWGINAHIEEWKDQEQPSSPLDGKKANRPALWTGASSPLDGAVQPLGHSTVEPKERLKKERKTDSGDEPQEPQVKPRSKTPFNVFMDRYLAECLDLKPGDPSKPSRDKVSAAYRRFGRAGKDVLAMADGDPERAMDAVNGVGLWLQDKGLSWTLDTIAQHALDYLRDPKPYTSGGKRA